MRGHYSLVGFHGNDTIRIVFPRSDWRGFHMDHFHVWELNYLVGWY